MKINKDKYIGKTFGQLLILGHKIVKMHHYFLCKCSCSKLKQIRCDNVLIGKVISCGCYNNSLAKGKAHIKHGFTSQKSIKQDQNFYYVWRALKQRCLNPNDIAYLYYGGRGIIICNRWLGKFGFFHFKEDMYESYLQHVKEFGKNNTTLDRIDVDGNYEPSNCRWATWSEQQLNKDWAVHSINWEIHEKWRYVLKRTISHIMNGGIKKHSIYEKYFGCSVQELRKHIESLFCEGMTWQNYGQGIDKWNIDHIKPIREFDLAIDNDRFICYNYKNLRPYWSVKNAKRKRGKLI